MSIPGIKPPFPYFGNKRSASVEIWRRFGNPARYVEPFAGSLGCLLARPHWRPGQRLDEIVNDLDGVITNFWRACRADPEGVWAHADRPRSQLDNRAIIKHLRARRPVLTAELEADPEYFDVRLAGYWVWHASTSFKPNVPGLCMRYEGGANGIQAITHDGHRMLASASMRIRHTVILCRDALAMLEQNPVVTCTHGNQITAVLLDPPYDNKVRSNLYHEDCGSIAAKVARWAFNKGDDPAYRIALCGMTGEHKVPDGWDAWTWSGTKSKGGSKGGGECIWFSPHCLKHDQLSLF